MTAEALQERFAELCREDLPSPGSGKTAERHRRIFAAGREDLSLAKLVEAHWDAVAILREAGREPAPGAKYAVWASERPGKELSLGFAEKGCTLTGTKQFCSGAGLVDRALISAEADSLVEVDLARNAGRIAIDDTAWQTEAFRQTNTSAVHFKLCPTVAILGPGRWYTDRPGFWQGACGPAAAWAGGAAGLVDYAMTTKREDAHTLAHLAAMRANVFAMESVLKAAADEFDAAPKANAMVTALMVRHVVEQNGTDVLRRFVRVLGPHPLAMHAEMSRRYAELDLFLRQSHAERDLETLGRALRED